MAGARCRSSHASLEFAQGRAGRADRHDGVERIDFVCAGALLNAVNRIEQQRKAVQIARRLADRPGAAAAHRNLAAPFRQEGTVAPSSRSDSHFPGGRGHLGQRCGKSSLTHSRTWNTFHGTTILSVRRDGAVALGGDGQVTLGNVVVKSTARKVRRLYHDRVLAGFAGATADAFTLFERFEAKLEKHQGHLTRAAVELAKDWRSDRVLRRLEAMLASPIATASLIITGTGDVLEPEHGIVAIGSGGPYAQAAARALLEHSTLVGRATSSSRRCRSPASFASTRTRTT